jgi:hypothetical protein
MTDVKCLYIGHEAGVVKAVDLADGDTQYEFTPYRSRAHLELEKKLAAKGAAPVILEWKGEHVAMTATSMEPHSIKLRKGHPPHA